MVNSFLLKNIEKILSKTRSLQKRLKSRPQQFQFQQGVSGRLLHSPHPIFCYPIKKGHFYCFQAHNKEWASDGSNIHITHSTCEHVLKDIEKQHKTKKHAKRQHHLFYLIFLNRAREALLERAKEKICIPHFINNFPLLAYYPPNILLLSTPLTLKHQEKEKRKYRRYRGHWRSGLYKKLYKTMQRIARNFFRTVL